MIARHVSKPILTLPLGTQVVTRVPLHARGKSDTLPIGAVGVVVALPDEARGRYAVRFPDGEVAEARRSDLRIRKHVARFTLSGLDEMLQAEQLQRYVIYRCVIGSRAYGLDHPGSDTDRRGIFLPPAEMQWSIAGVPEQLENNTSQECYWEVQKFLQLALKANPNILECLYSPLVEAAEPLALELLAMRGAFLSRLVYQTYNGYVLSQFKKLEQDLRTAGDFKWKHAMHLIRLLMSGVTTLREGYVPVRFERDRDRLLSIRQGEMAWEHVNTWRLALHAAFDDALRDTSLPAEPDYRRANDFLIRARRSMVGPSMSTDQ